MITTNTKNTDVINVERIVSINCADLSPMFEAKENKHSQWEFVYVDSGCILSVTEDSSTTVSQGQLIFHRPDEIHSTICNRKQGATIFTVIFDCKSPDISYFDKKAINVPSELRPLLTDLMRECDKTYDILYFPITLRKNALIGSEQLTRIYLEAFLIRLMQSDAPKTKKTSKASENSTKNTLSEAMAQYLTRHAYERVTLDRLSEEFHFGKVYLCDVFKRDMGCTIITYLLDLKINEAKRLLRESDATVSEISEKLGFESPSYFSRCFKSRVGHPPKSFRRMLISGSAIDPLARKELNFQ